MDGAHDTKVKGQGDSISNSNYGDIVRRLMLIAGVL